MLKGRVTIHKLFYENFASHLIIKKWLKLCGEKQKKGKRFSSNYRKKRAVHCDVVFVVCIEINHSYLRVHYFQGHNTRTVIVDAIINHLKKGKRLHRMIHIMSTKTFSIDQKNKLEIHYEQDVV